MPYPAAPPSHPELSDDRGSSRCLDEVGPVTVLGAMVEHRRHSSSSDAQSPESPGELDADDADAVATQRRPRLDPNSDLFQKIR